jgi:hypothetical protein
MCGCEKPEASELLRRGNDCPFLWCGKRTSLEALDRETLMALSHHHPVVPASKEQRHCAMMFCLTWVGFFVVVGAIAWFSSAL